MQTLMPYLPRIVLSGQQQQLQQDSIVLAPPPVLEGLASLSALRSRRNPVQDRIDIILNLMRLYLNAPHSRVYPSWPFATAENSALRRIELRESTSSWLSDYLNLVRKAHRITTFSWS